ncbi:MAG: Crp/Fnr family transcriptional regulator [Bacilli bacterium]|nr:Crp/Fnr family transcriptional regulator [Bacilli bacterium]
MKNLFENISLKNKEKLFKIFRASTVKFTKGINIIDYMDRTNSIGIIDTGSIDIIQTDYDGNETLIDELKENDIFGSTIYSIVLSDECSIITKDNTNVTFIDYREIENAEFIKSDFYITFVQNLLAIIFEQMSFKNKRIDILTKKTIRNKLLTYFKQLSKEQGSKSITLPFSLSHLARFISVDRSAMIREIKYLKEEGMIDQKTKKIRLYY